MKRLLCLGTLFAAAVAMAQNAPAPTLASLAQTARQKAADWDTLAQALDASIGRLLPCDPKGPAAIEEVSRASDARLAALADYLQAASAAGLAGHGRREARARLQRLLWRPASKRKRTRSPRSRPAPIASSQTWWRAPRTGLPSALPKTLFRRSVPNCRSART